jgi:hypothetical protein
MIRRFFVLSTLLLCAAGVASAESFTFTYTGLTGSTASGTLTTTAEGGNEFLITGISDGLVDGTAITSLLNANAYEGNDNLLFFSQSTTDYLDNDGFSFATASGEVNLFDGALGYSLDATNLPDDILGSFTVTPVVSTTPEPSSFLLLGTGMLSAMSLFRRKVAGSLRQRGTARFA